MKWCLHWILVRKQSLYKQGFCYGRSHYWAAALKSGRPSIICLFIHKVSLWLWASSLQHNTTLQHHSVWADWMSHYDYMIQIYNTIPTLYRPNSAGLKSSVILSTHPHAEENYSFLGIIWWQLGYIAPWFKKYLLLIQMALHSSVDIPEGFILFRPLLSPWVMG